MAIKPRTHAGTEVGAVQLRVSDMARSEAFYTDVLGLRVLNRYDGLTRLTVDGIHPLIVLEEIADAVQIRPRTTSGLYHFALLVPTRSDLGLVLRQLAECGVQLGSADHDVSEALYLSDPDHNGIEIYWDRPVEQWSMLESGQIYMSADALDAHGLLREAEGRQWTGMPAGTRMGHVHLHVRNLTEAERFYCGLLGFSVKLRYGPSALFVAAGGYHHHLGLNTWAGVGAPPTPEKTPGLAHYTIVNPDVRHIEDILVWLEEAGIAVETKGDGWYFRDPSGIGVRLTTCPVL
ncbi:VOC family protein [Paenibacillus sp. 1P07SE]|uniref:VOC family protein n=1 Tax=Paenibacillus sp. 1P07SE TaxID=3132209 RepID=UPI0039A75E7D